MDNKDLQKERTSLFTNVYSNKIPSRIPVDVTMYFEAAVQFAGKDLKLICWDTKGIENCAENVCERLYSDCTPVRTIQIRKPSFYTLLKSQSFIMGNTGIMQHPEVVGLEYEEYDEFIEKPLDTLLEKVLPRQYKSLSPANPCTYAMNLYKALELKNADNAVQVGIAQRLIEKHGYFGGFSMEETEAPMDFLGDQLRGFSNILKDIRRCPDKVKAATERLYPYAVLSGTSETINEFSRAEFPLHMPPFMREKDFATFWWPTFIQTCNTLASMGIQIRLMVEQDWTRYLDYLTDLPANTLMICESGNPQLFKDKLGKKHILSGFYPIVNFKTSTKQECVDHAKKLIDILAPSGNYLFQFDKDIISSDGMDLEKINAVTEYVRDHGRYDNVGKPAGMKFEKDDYTAKAAEPEFKASKYYQTIEDYAGYADITSFGAQKLHSADQKMIRMIMSLLY